MLLSAPHFGQDAEFEQGRYRELFSSGYQVQEVCFKETEEQRRDKKGMAEVALLDRQLRVALRRGKEASSSEEDIEAKQQDQAESALLTRSAQLLGVQELVSYLRAVHAPMTSDAARVQLLLAEEQREASSFQRMLPPAEQE